MRDIGRVNGARNLALKYVRFESTRSANVTPDHIVQDCERLIYRMDQPARSSLTSSAVYNSNMKRTKRLMLKVIKSLIETRQEQRD
jgi:hypothetical protein